MSIRICPAKGLRTGRTICRKVSCGGCEYSKPESNAERSGSLKRPKTCEYLRRKIAQKKTHILREEERVAMLQELLDEQERN